jgi:hypothetical protein
MSDTDSDSSSPRRSARHSARLSDFPLETPFSGRDIERVSAELQRLTAALQANPNNRERARALPPAAPAAAAPGPARSFSADQLRLLYPEGPPQHPTQVELVQRAQLFLMRVEASGQILTAGQQRLVDEMQQIARDIHQNKPVPQALKPVTVVVSALPKTTYRDEDDKTPHSLAYVKAQRAVLKLLSTTAADAIPPERLCQLTQSIGQPSAINALRFCYYMRSQGIDVYPSLGAHKLLSLRVVNPLSHSRSQDHVYWQQNYATNHTLHALEEVPIPRPGTLARPARRNAVAPAAQANDPRTVLEFSIQQAEARLERELESANSDPEYVWVEWWAEGFQANVGVG